MSAQARAGIRRQGTDSTASPLDGQALWASGHTMAPAAWREEHRLWRGAPHSEATGARRRCPLPAAPAAPECTRASSCCDCTGGAGVGREWAWGGRIGCQLAAAEVCTGHRTGHARARERGQTAPSEGSTARPLRLPRLSATANWASVAHAGPGFGRGRRRGSERPPNKLCCGTRALPSRTWGRARCSLGLGVGWKCRM